MQDMKLVVETSMPIYDAHTLRYTLGYMRKNLAHSPSYAATFKTSLQPAGYACWIRRGWAPLEGGTTYALVTYTKVLAVDSN